GPDWMSSARFDISAKVPAGTTKAQSNVMLRNLLADRFKLVLHHSTKEASIYVLLVAKGGPKLKESAKESTDDAAAAPPSGGQGRRADASENGTSGARCAATNRRAHDLFGAEGTAPVEARSAEGSGPSLGDRQYAENTHGELVSAWCGPLGLPSTITWHEKA